MSNVLNDETLLKVLNKLTNYDKDLGFIIDKSLSSNSYYITITYKGYKRSCRVSDHHTKPGMINSIITGKHTKRKTLESFITNVIKKLKQMYIKGETNG